MSNSPSSNQTPLRQKLIPLAPKVPNNKTSSITHDSPLQISSSIPTASMLKKSIGTSQSHSASGPSAGPPSPDSKVPETQNDLPTIQNRNPTPDSENETHIIATNPDYIALNSALSMLQAQRRQACSDIVELQRLKKEALADPTTFFKNLESGALAMKLPKMQRITRAPLVSLRKYEGSSLEHNIKLGLVDRQTHYGATRMFDN